MENNGVDVGLSGNGVIGESSTGLSSMNQDEQILLQKQVCNWYNPAEIYAQNLH